MLILTIPGASFWDEANEVFIDREPTILRMEHSLASIAKWESKWKKAWLNTPEKTLEETIDYLRCMTLNEEPISNETYELMPVSCMREINAYIDDAMTATTFHDRNKRPSRDIITAELLYFRLVDLGIPFDPCENWHLNRLLALIRVCDIKKGPQKKMSRKDAMAQQRALNAQRLKASGSTG